MKRLPSLSLTTIWLLLPIMLVVWSTLLDPLRRLDFWWHLKVGQLILERGQIPATDIFSFTEYGKSFAHPNWLAEVLFYVLWRIGGLELLVLFNAVVISTAFLIIYRTAFLQTTPPAQRRQSCWWLRSHLHCTAIFVPKYSLLSCLASFCLSCGTIASGNTWRSFGFSPV